ncbi:MAG: polyhydroxyalkanoate depolymerase [Hyphomonadaceae bacterium]|nr:polyhydroxyalkanoate depolymerase [Hyphomonadaceae bacterium]
MLYSLYELNHLAVAPLRAAAMVQGAMMRSPFNPASETEMARTAAAASDLFETVTRRYRKPEWGIKETIVNGAPVGVSPKPVWSSAWCSMVHFQRDRAALKKARRDNRRDAKVLIVAPMSGHYATLLRGTVEAFLPEHEVYITDWADARMVPIIAGRFDLNDYIDHVAMMLRVLGPGAHVVAVCQPGPPVLAAVSIMSERDDPCLPSTMTIMGSPIDARLSPTQPNLLAAKRPYSWFERTLIHSVPPVYPGAFRSVYPGFLQLAGFLGMNLARHVDAHWEYYKNLVKDDGDSAQKHRIFYDEYLSVCDLTEEFYLQTIKDVFQEFKLPRGLLEHRGRLVRPQAIKRTALMTVEGENDDISGIGQTQAAHELCASLPASMRLDYVQPGVGHYGVFNGRRFTTEIYPRIREFMRTHEVANDRSDDAKAGDAKASAS